MQQPHKYKTQHNSALFAQKISLQRRFKELKRKMIVQGMRNLSRYFMRNIFIIDLKILKERIAKYFPLIRV